MVGSADMVQVRPSNKIGVPVRTLYGRFLACYFMTATLSIVVISRYLNLTLHIYVSDKSAIF